MQINRRDFLKGAAFVGGAAMASMAACSPQASNEGEDASGLKGGVQEVESGAGPGFMVASDPIVEDQISDTQESDVVVVGAGTAGLVTALSALQNGLSVTLVSASSAPIARGGSNNAVYSKVMAEYGVPRIEYSDIQNELVQGSGMPDQRKWMRYWNNSEEAMNWLIDIMEGDGYLTVLEDCAALGEACFNQPVSSHCWCPADQVSAGGGQPLVVATLERRIQEAGGKLVYNTVAKQLVRGGEANGTSGRVEAVIAQATDGSYGKFVGNKAVVLATGDFSGNGEMMRHYCEWAAPYYDDLQEVDYDITINMGGLYRGDGQQMGLWVGAAWQKTPVVPMGGNVCVGPWRQLQENFAGLLVNRNGQRYMNEAATSALGGMSTTMQPGHAGYAIWNEDYARFHDGAWHPFGSAYKITPTLPAADVIASWNATDSYVKADTLEELLSQMGLPVAETMATIDRYNEMCDAGVDVDFCKPAEFLCSLKEGPFYGAMNDAPDAMTVLGGLRTNDNMQVCDEEDVPIPGLYNVGTMVGDMFGGIYTFRLQGVNLGANCLTFGYLTGKFIAENE